MILIYKSKEYNHIMITFFDTVDAKSFDSIKNYSLDEILFFDIETTGLSPDVSSIYLIGCMYMKEGSFLIKQWFADDYTSEKQMITEFFDFMNSFSLLIHYNGSGFDIPYLEKKCQKYALNCTFSNINTLDIYKAAKKRKDCLHLEHYKQKNVEEFCGYKRTDPFHGGELITVYSSYMQHHLLGKPCESELDALLLHNKEDLIGLSYTVQILRYQKMFEGGFTINDVTINNDTLHISAKIDSMLPQPVFFPSPFIQATKNKILAQIPLYHGVLKFFYPNYKDYFYLPSEDTAIHKSVAAYVDKSHRQKAKASTCYVKKDGIFVPQSSEAITPSFQEDYKSTPYYFELKEELISDFDFWKQYIIREMK